MKGRTHSLTQPLSHSTSVFAADQPRLLCAAPGYNEQHINKQAEGRAAFFAFSATGSAIKDGFSQSRSKKKNKLVCLSSAFHLVGLLAAIVYVSFFH